MSMLRRTNRLATRPGPNRTQRCLTTFNEIDMSAGDENRSKIQDAVFEKGTGVNTRVHCRSSPTAVEAFATVLPQPVTLKFAVTRWCIAIKPRLGIAIGGGKGLVVPGATQCRSGWSFVFQIEDSILRVGHVLAER